MSKASWREAIRIHPAADIFPMLDDADLVALGEDIKRNGLNSPIAIVVEKATPILLDGRNRLAAMERVGIKVRLSKRHVRGYFTYYLDADDFEFEGDGVEVIHSDPKEYVASANLHRRHLTAETKHDLIAQLLKEKPERSDRATAEIAKVDHKTVGVVRRQEEMRGNIPHVGKRVDTKGRRQPTDRKRQKPVIVLDPETATLDQVRGAFLNGAEDVGQEITLHSPCGEKLWSIPCTLASQAIGNLKQLADLCRSSSPVAIASYVRPDEVVELQSSLAVIEEWLSRFAVTLAERNV